MRLNDKHSAFVSYCHDQAEWVRTRLVPILRAGGINVLIDHERFTPGRSLPLQISQTQEAAFFQILVISNGYIESAYCMKEMRQAVSMDPNFQKGIIIPIKLAPVQLPEEIRSSDPLYLDFTDDKAHEPWDLLLNACGSKMVAQPPKWLFARDEIKRLIRRGASVNFVVDGPVEWRQLISNLQSEEPLDLKVVNLEKPATISRRGLVKEIMSALGGDQIVPDEPNDLEELERFIELKPRNNLALIHFDLAAYRDAYGVDFFAALRYLVTETSNLVLLVQSRRPFATLLPRDHPLSDLSLLQVRLEARR